MFSIASDKFVARSRDSFSNANEIVPHINRIREREEREREREREKEGSEKLD